MVEDEIAAEIKSGFKFRWAAWIAVIIGLWFIASPYVFGLSDELTPLWNNVAVGIVVAAFALVDALTGWFWTNWIYGLGGIWGIVSPFVLDFDITGLVWSNVIAGIVVIILAVVTWFTSRETT